MDGHLSQSFFANFFSQSLNLFRPACVHETMGGEGGEVERGGGKTEMNSMLPFLFVRFNGISLK